MSKQFEVWMSASNLVSRIYPELYREYSESAWIRTRPFKIWEKFWKRVGDS